MSATAIIIVSRFDHRVHNQTRTSNKTCMQNVLHGSYRFLSNLVRGNCRVWNSIVRNSVDYPSRAVHLPRRSYGELSRKISKTAHLRIQCVEDLGRGRLKEERGWTANEPRESSPWERLAFYASIILPRDRTRWQASLICDFRWADIQTPDVVNATE